MTKPIWTTAFAPSPDANVAETAQAQKMARAPIAATNETIAGRINESYVNRRAPDLSIGPRIVGARSGTMRAWRAR